MRRAWVLLFSGLFFVNAWAGDGRRIIPLNKDWRFNQVKTIDLPASFERHEGVDFDGIGVYEKTIPPLPIKEGERVLLHFQASATLTSVKWDGQSLGDHLGGWTPFRFDVTELCKKESSELWVQVDEKTGHNTQGFLPIIAPHFGGIWQEVFLIVLPKSYINDLELLAHGDPETQSLHLEFPIVSTPEKELVIKHRLLGTKDWKKNSFPAKPGINKLKIPNPSFKLWSPQSPNLYEVEICLGRDLVRTRAGFRTFETSEDKLLLNNKPIGIRGVLNWGYYPPDLEPYPKEEEMRGDILWAKSMGFNLMKFCLWIPPKRFLELADEMGIMTWMEYPTWHPTFTGEHLKDLKQEFYEFFCYDRNHPSVALRSLTCETGPSAELAVIKSLYDMAHDMIPNAVVEDDSSWIGWNRIHDFYDDHPYGNNHTWVATLGRLKAHIEKYEKKPLVLGEAIAGDTWVDKAPLDQKLGDDRPYWAPRFYDANIQWKKKVIAPDCLKGDSKHYAMLMRKYQVETYRREVPFGGYVISVIRDVSLCAMGLMDYLGKPKWTEKDWEWHRDVMCLMKTKNDCRSFESGAEFGAAFLVSSLDQEHKDPIIHVGEIQVPLDEVNGFKLPEVEAPKRDVVRSSVLVGEKVYKNQWPIWMVPKLEEETEVKVVHQMTEPLLDKLVQGAKVLMLPNGDENSFPLRNHWFLRGGPFVVEHPLLKLVPRKMLVELQHFDLAGQVIPQINYLDQIDPILLLWDNHDLDEVKTHGLVFETRVGKGRLLVSALRHNPEYGAAGPYLKELFCRHLEEGPLPKNQLSPACIQRMRDRLSFKGIELINRSWRFKPDKKNIGIEQGWAKAGFKPDNSWNPISIDRAWEAQGYETLDGWAWYHIGIEVPLEWEGHNIYLSFEGVDDYYVLYVNGNEAGSGGDLENQDTAFDEKKSHNINQYIKLGFENGITVRVHDWGGAGGIFRPVTLGTVGFSEGPDLLR